MTTNPDYETHAADALTVRPGQAVTYHQVSPPAHPTSLGDVWVGWTKPRSGLLVEVGKRCTCASGSLLSCPVDHDRGTTYFVNGTAIWRGDG